MAAGELRISASELQAAAKRNAKYRSGVSQSAAKARGLGKYGVATGASGGGQSGFSRSYDPAAIKAQRKMVARNIAEGRKFARQYPAVGKLSPAQQAAYGRGKTGFTQGMQSVYSRQPRHPAGTPRGGQWRGKGG